MTMQKKMWLKIFLLVTIIYAIYDGIYFLSNSKRLLLSYSKISSGIIPLVTLYNDIFLIVLVFCVLYFFNRRQLLTVLSVETRGEMIGMGVGILIFLLVVLKVHPSYAVDAYMIIHTLTTVALVEEVIFRGVVLNTLIDMGVGHYSYPISGMLWGAIYGLKPIIMGGIAPLSALLPVLLWGLVVGTVLGVLYQKTGSLWLVVYLHAAFSLL